MLTETSVRASDRRAVFVGVDAYEAAGGVVLRDLFQGDDGGWLEDPALLDRLITEKLQAEAEALASEGWKWIEVATDLPYGYSHGLRRLLDWSTGVYNPDVEISRDTTTLYASDRDVFMFLADDHNPIEAGRLPDGSPDLYFRGFYCWNSEVGAKTLGMASFYLRAVCQNRNLWSVEDFQEITIRHSKYAASRFAHEAAPALTRFANSSPQGFVNGIKVARQQIVARTDEDRDDFLRKRGFSKAESGKIIEKVLMEEGRPPESIFDFVQGITRLARDKTNQDARLDMEGRAKKLLDRVG